jgi:hypothetical protein
MPNDMWNFQYAGYNAVGGRLDRLPDGNLPGRTQDGPLVHSTFSFTDFGRTTALLGLALPEL